MTCVQNLHQLTSKITSLSRSGHIASARKLFDEMPQKDLIAWNAMLTSYSKLGFTHEALKLFTSIRHSGIKPDHFTFTSSLSACANAGELHFGKKLHGLVITMGYQSALPVSNSVIDLYGKCLMPSCARRLFDEMEQRNEVSWCALLFAYVKVGDFESGGRVFDDMPIRINIAWNILMAGYSRCGEIGSCMDLFKQMQSSSSRPDQWTYIALMNACSEVLEPFHGCVVQACIIKSGWSSAVEVNNSILSYYAQFNCLEEVVKIFRSIGSPTQVSWNAVINAYMKMGFVREALEVFQQAPVKNIVSWTAMVTGYMRNGYGEQALSFFVDMIRNLQRPDDFTLGAVLHACSNLAVLGHGRMVHCCAIHCGFHSYTYVGNGLINMYAKCGDLDGSSRAFNDIFKTDLISWNAMLFGFGLHGRSVQALKVYNDMLTAKVRPDKVTFIGLLMTCSHSGLIERGQDLFKSMFLVHGLVPEADHIACMVDLLGRGGHLRQASMLIEEYSETITASSQEAFLGACAAHGYVRLGAKVGEALKLMEPEKDISYMMLSNFYCTRGQWKEAEKVRKAMKDQGVKKRPGCSWVEVGNKVVSFVAGYQSHQQIEQLCKLLNFLDSEMRNPSLITFQCY